MVAGRYSIRPVVPVTSSDMPNANVNGQLFARETPKYVRFLRRARQRVLTTAKLSLQHNTNPSSAFYSVPLTGSDDSDLGYHCTEVITVGLRVLGVSGELPGCEPLV